MRKDPEQLLSSSSFVRAQRRLAEEPEILVSSRQAYHGAAIVDSNGEHVTVVYPTA